LSSPATAPDPLPPPSTPDCPRPLRADAVRNRACILAAAREVFAERGTEAHAEEVARRAGLGVGTLYRHFPDKEALARAVLEHKVEEVKAFIEEECIPDPDPWAGLERVFRNAGAGQAENRGWADAVSAALGDDPAMCLHRDRLTPPVMELVRRGQEAGVVRDDLRGEDLFGLFCGLGAVARSGQDWERYLAVVLAGLRAGGDR